MSSERVRITIAPVDERPPASPAVKTIEQCIASHHLASVRYVNAEGVEETLRVRPIAIRWNKSHHLVVWAEPADPGGPRVEELRLDRLISAEDAGEEPAPPS